MARRIRAKSPGLPIVARSGLAREQHAEDLKALGICSFLQKPYSVEEPRNAIFNRLRSVFLLCHRHFNDGFSSTERSCAGQARTKGMLAVR